MESICEKQNSFGGLYVDYAIDVWKSLKLYRVEFLVNTNNSINKLLSSLMPRQGSLS